MKQILESLVKYKIEITKLFSQENSHNKNENNFYGPVYFINRQPKQLSEKSYKSIS